MAKKRQLPKSKGIKFDQEKAPVQLIPNEALFEIAKVLGFGAKKYGKDNWKNGIEYERLLGAALRHIYAFNSGQDKDPESGINHIAHAATNLMMLLWMCENKLEMDDRWKDE